MTNPAQGPSFCDYFRSFYCTVENTYYPPVDLSEEALRAKGYLADDASIPESLRHPEVRKILAQPLTTDPEKAIEECAVLSQYGLEAMKYDGIPSKRVIHTKEGRWVYHASIVPPECPRGTPENNLENNLLQIELNERIKQVGTQFEVIVPKNLLILLDNQAQETEVLKKYYILEGPLKRLSQQKSIAKIKQMSPEKQITLATQLCFLVQKVGLSQINLNWFRLDRDGRISIFTLPAGVLVAKQSGVCRGVSIEKCARIGLSWLVEDVKREFGETTEEGGAFRAHIESVHAQVMRPKLSKWKITLSVLSLGVLPLIYVIISLIQVRAIQRRCQSLNQLIDSYEKGKGSFTSAQEENQLQKITDLTNSIFSMTEEVPFSHVQSIFAHIAAYFS